jgi:pyrophosphatase PpaX
MQKKSYTAYLFDADGTLIDTADMIYRCFFKTCRTFGNFDIDRDLVMRHVGQTLRAQFDLYLGPMSDARAEEVQQAHMAYQLSIYRETLRAFPTVPEGLAKLKAAGHRLAVVTSRRMLTLELYLKHCNLWEFFDVFVTPEMTEKHKPDAQPALKALDLLGVSAVSALFVGDAIWDVACAAAAGIDCAFVAWSETDPATLPSRPQYIIGDMRTLP